MSSEFVVASGAEAVEFRERFEVPGLEGAVEGKQHLSRREGFGQYLEQSPDPRLI